MFKKHWLLGLIIILACLLRTWDITSSPSGLSIDEVSIGYNAWSIITTGADEHAKSFPLFFKAFGEYKLPAYIYSVALIQLIIGPTDLSVRLPAVLFGLGAIISFYFFSKLFLKGFFNEKLSEWGAYLAAFLMAISPWHIQFARAGFEASSALFFTTLGVCLFFKAKTSASSKLLILATTSFALSLYSYNSARIVVPVLALTLTAVYFKAFKPGQWLKALLVGFALTIPFILFTLNPEGSARAREVVIFYRPEEAPYLKTLAQNYWNNISPYYLFYYGDPTLSHTTPHRMSLLYLLELPFFFAGLILLILKIRKSLFILIWALIGAVPAAITILNPHALRGFLGLPALIFISTFGFLTFLNLLKKDPFKKVALSVYILPLSYLCFNFLFIYHNLYIRDSGWDWLSDLKSVSREVELIKKDYDQIYFEDGGFRTIAYLWHFKYPPEKYQKTLNKKHIENMHFEFPYAGIQPTGQNLYITRTPGLPAKLIQTITYPNGSPAYYLYKM